MICFGYVNLGANLELMRLIRKVSKMFKKEGEGKYL